MCAGVRAFRVRACGIWFWLGLTWLESFRLVPEFFSGFSFTPNLLRLWLWLFLWLCGAASQCCHCCVSGSSFFVLVLGFRRLCLRSDKSSPSRADRRLCVYRVGAEADWVLSSLLCSVMPWWSFPWAVFLSSSHRPCRSRSCSGFLGSRSWLSARDLRRVCSGVLWSLWWLCAWLSTGAVSEGFIS